MIDKIIASVVAVIVVIFAGVILYTSVFSGQLAQRTVVRQQYEQDYSSLLVQSLFISHEQESGMTYETLLSRSLREINTTITVDGKRIDVKRKFTDALDTLLGPDGYYMSVKPLMKGVTVSYILDGSNTMAEKRQQVNASLPAMMASLRDQVFGQNASIYVHLYLLKASDTAHPCSEFSLPANVTCEEIGGDSFYQQMMAEGFDPPTVPPYRSYNEWVYSNHLASAFDFSQSDWASAVAYASYNYSHNDIEQATTNKHIIIAAADELPTSSKSDECFAKKVSNDANDNDFFFCMLCNSTCPVTRSQGVINQTRDILKKDGDLFVGFHDFACDYNYSTDLSKFTLTNYTCHYLDSPLACTLPPTATTPGGPAPPTSGRITLPAGVNWCDQQACGGCKTPTPPATPPASFPGAYCFHSNCDSAIVDELTDLASASDGTVYDLKDLSKLTTVVNDYFTGAMTSFDFTLGEKNDTRQRYIIEEPLTLASGERITLTLWIYERPNAIEGK